MNLKLIPVFVLMLGLLACGKDSDKTKSGALAVESVNHTSSSSVKEIYQFTYNGCDTGKKEFSAEDKTEVRKALCDGLQNDKLNNGCAYSLRYNHFQSQCSDMVWSPY